ncbi:pitrilysin family protein [Clostridium sp. UBA7503]|uniref:M16 family metallopeptidase n=1 Tax=Clostridium sp. UBA7503 TaxID=1946377 RepID=UPI0032168CD9
MDKIFLKHGVRLLYERVPGNITSFTIGLEAGANSENSNNMGIAHAVEHMVFKGTHSKSEKEINEICNEYLGFHNAMTNYPYVVYYGSSLKEDFKNAFNIYFDIVFNPAFREEGFKEEMAVIIEELKEWSDDVVQHCEDFLFYETFEKRRIKEVIIGREETIKAITLEQIREYHEKFYTLDNCVISVITALELSEVIEIIEGEITSLKKTKPLLTHNTCQIAALKGVKPSLIQKSFERVSSRENQEEKTFSLYENPKAGVFIEENLSINGCKVQYIFPIHNLSEREVTLLQLFNEYFVGGTSSLLYDEIRTKRGLVYDIQGKVKGEKGIKLYTITLSTSKENIDLVREIIKENIDKVKTLKGIFTEDFVKKYIKSQNLKRMLTLEKSIILSMHLAVYEIMHSGGELLLNEFYKLSNCTEEEILSMINKVFIKETLGIIRN